MSEFKFFDRGYSETTALVPGWAADYRIFDALDLAANYLVPTAFSPSDFNKDLLQAMARYGLNKISVMGWSMGGFVACDFISGHRDCVKDAVLISVRRRYERQELEEIKAALEKNRRAFLYRFYKDCFSKDEKKEFAWFREKLLKDYVDRMGPAILLEGLDYLSESEIRTERIEGMRIALIHGRDDRIAPIEEVLELKEALPNAVLTVIDDAGHMPFLRSDFKDMVDKAHAPHR